MSRRRHQRNMKRLVIVLAIVLAILATAVLLLPPFYSDQRACGKTVDCSQIPHSVGIV